MKSSNRILFIALIGATLIKLYLALTTEGSLDAAGFLDHLHKIREFGVGAYRVRGALDNPFNSPPPMIYLIRTWGWLTDHTGIRFAFWLRLPSIIADIGSFLCVGAFLEKESPTAKRFPVLVALALCPTAILISGYHGNTDSLMIFLVLLSIYFVETDKPRWQAGVVFGLALSVKVMPLCFIPALFFYLKDLRTRAQFFCAATFTFIVCSLPYLAQDPKAIWASVFGYGSIYGHWGWSLLAVLTFPTRPTYLHEPFDVQGSHAVFAQILKFLTIAAILIVSLWLNRREKNPSLFVQSGLITAIVLFMAPGFGVQYLVWLVPFVAALGSRMTFTYYTLSASYLLIAYLCWASLVCFPRVALFLTLICWLLIFMLIVEFRNLLSDQIAKTQS